MSDKDLLATEIVKKYSLYTAGVGLIPLPLVDFAGIAVVELKMLADLAKVYDVPLLSPLTMMGEVVPVLLRVPGVDTTV